MSKIKYRPYLLLILILIGCHHPNNGDKKVNIVDIEDAYLNRTLVHLSDLGVQKVEYIALQTSDSSLLNNNLKAYVDDSLLVVVGFRTLKLYNRENGQFIKNLAKFGQDPYSIQATLPYLEPTISGNFFVKKENKVFTIDFGSRLTQAINIPAEVSTFCQINNNLLVGYIPNFLCSQDRRLVIFNSEGQIKETFFNPLTCKANNRVFSIDFDEGSFHKDQTEAVFFKESFNDTLFKVQENHLLPDTRFDLGQFSHPYEDKEFMTKEEAHNFAYIGQIDQSENYLLFQVYLRGKTHYGLFNKKTKSTSISQSNKFADDINGFIGFSPQYIDQEGNLIGILKAEELYEWLQSNKNIAKSLPKGLERFKGIKPDDNPIIAIASFE